MENILEHRDRVGVADAILLEDFKSEDAYLENLRMRYRENYIYTYIGQVLVSVNPYKELEIYSNEYLERYRKVNFYEVPPHVYAIAENAYRSMTSENQDQCILISGESGSGKTEASKHILRFVASSSLHTREVDRIRDRLLQSNPVLEAFGNAKTNRNDNSSRFGKYMDIECNYKGDPTGGHIINYLLEKSRVVHQEKGERNFHIFYQLLRGASDETLNDLGLTDNPRDYFFLNQGKSSLVPAIDDSRNFSEVRSALDIIDFKREEQDSMWKVVAAILHLGNVQYETGEDENARITDSDSITKISELLECDEHELIRALTHRTIDAKGDKVTSPLNLEQALFARDALAKAIYERLFNWLVSRLNESLQSEERKTKKSLIGILDIYGFEIFDNNGFEQFCINYCNEKLQQIFIELTLRSEQEEYLREGIQWEQVEYFDNKVICDLVEEKHKGIIALMDEECLRPGEATDITFLNKMDQRLCDHAHYFSYQTSNNNKVKKNICKDEFRLRHYAGEVAYSVKGFLEKNNDLLYKDLKVAMSHSKKEMVTELFPEGELIKMRRPTTAATQFKQSLAQLMQILMIKEPSYIRCIKPNDYKRPADFDNERIRHQVQYLGLMENLRVRRAGFAYRRSYEIFLNRYKSLCPQTWPHYEGTAKDGVKVLIEHLKYSPDEYRLGQSKLFIRLPKTLFKTEDAFQKRKHELASKIQAIYKGKLQLRKYRKMIEAITTITKNWRRVLARRLKAKRKWATIVVRKFVHGFVTRHDELINDDNAKFQKLVRHHWLMKLSNNIPSNILGHHESWPEAPVICKEASKTLRRMHLQFLVGKYVHNMKKSRKKQFNEKILAEKLFKGKKSSYRESFPNWFKTSRLNSEEESLCKTAFEVGIKDSSEKTIYSTSCTKYDRRGYKARERILILTSMAIYLLEAKENKLKTKHRLTLQEVTGIVVSANKDGLLIIQIPPENTKKDKGDLILNVPNAIEVVTKFVTLTSNENILSIMTADSMNHTMKNGKQGTIILDKGVVSSINKNKEGNLVVVGGR